jgi:phosphate transport system protein
MRRLILSITRCFRELLTYMMEDPHSISYCTQLLLSIKNIERMGDQRM